MKRQVDSIVASIIRGFHIYNDICLGILVFATSTGLFIQSFSIKIMKDPVSAVDTARFFPQLVFGALIPIGLVFILRGFSTAKKNKETVPDGEKLEDAVMAFERGSIALFSIAALVALMVPLGFIPASIIYLVVSMFFMSAKEGWKPIAYVVTAILVTVLCYFLFRQFVYVRLPAGILKGVLG